MTAALFTEFEPATTEQWIEAVRESLRDRPLESLTKSNYEDIPIHPWHGADDLTNIAHQHSLPGQFPFLRGTTAAGYRAAPWLITQAIEIDDLNAFNNALQEGLANGQTAITLTDCPQINDVEELQRTFAEIDLSRFPLYWSSQGSAAGFYQLLCETLTADQLKNLHGCIGLDPLGSLAQTGEMPAAAFESMARHVRQLTMTSPQLGSIAISTGTYHDAGANAVQELALALATAVTYLRELGERGLDLETVARKLHVFLNIGENFFIELAKFRAIKSLWAQIMHAFDLSPAAQKVQLHACSGTRNKTSADVHTNLLRLTTEALSAALGGVHSIHLAPFDTPLGTIDDSSRRLARNIQLILQEELQLTKLIDPAGGAWHIEKLTDQLARAAWALFQTIEAHGGTLESLQSGWIQTEIETVAAQRQLNRESQETLGGDT